jgi:outer membrane protein W
MPTFTLRFSPLPSSALKSITQNHGIYPYLGMGIGYGIGFATYELKSSEFDFEKKTHNYFGMIYQGIVGVSVRISSRTAFIFETMYEKATFNQKLYNKEKNFDFERDEFSIDGMKLLIGIRFGMF